MAEEKKETASDEWFGRLVEIIFIIILLVSLFNWIAPKLQNLFNFDFTGGAGSESFSIPPRTYNDEAGLLGAILSGKVRTEEAFGKLTDGMFRDLRNRAVFSAMKSLYEDNIPVTLNSLEKRLAERGDLTNVGGRPYLEQLIKGFEESAKGEESAFSKFHRVLKQFLLSLAVISMIGISYIFGKLLFLQKEQAALFLDIMPETDANKSDTVWKRLLELSQSNNPSDRKIAIIEADALLDDMVTQMGYSGDTLGEKLKKIERSDFLTLQDAWEAHKYRNEIAHKGIQITKREAQQVMMLYEKVFREFEYL